MHHDPLFFVINVFYASWYSITTKISNGSLHRRFYHTCSYFLSCVRASNIALLNCIYGLRHSADSWILRPGFTKPNLPTCLFIWNIWSGFWGCSRQNFTVGSHKYKFSYKISLIWYNFTMNWLKIEWGREIINFSMTFFEQMRMRMLNTREKSTFYLAGKAE